MMYFESSRQLFAAAAGFSVSLWAFVGAVIDVGEIDQAIERGVTGVLALAIVVTFAVLVFIYHGMITLYHRLIADRDRRIEQLESELREERAKHSG